MAIDEKMVAEKVRAALFDETGDVSTLLIDDELLRRAIDETVEEVRRQAIAAVKDKVRVRFGAMLESPVARAVEAVADQMAEQAKVISDEMLQAATVTTQETAGEAMEVANRLRVPRPHVGRYLLTVEPKNVALEDITEELRGIIGGLIGGDSDWFAGYLRNFDVRVPYRTHAVLVEVGELSLRPDRKSYGDIVAAAAIYGLVPCPIGIIPEIAAATDGIKYLRMALNIAPRDCGAVYSLGRGSVNSRSGNVEWCAITTAQSENFSDDRVMVFAIIE